MMRDPALLMLITVLLAGCGPEAVVVDRPDDAAEVEGDLSQRFPSRGPFARLASSTWAQATWPVGARYVNGEGSALQVGVYSSTATRILLEVYTRATGADAAYSYWMAKGPDNVWRAQLDQVPGKALYAFRAWGPNWPYSTAWTRGGSSAGFIVDVDGAGNRFNPNKVLFDPYARELSHDKTSPELLAAGFNGELFGTGPVVYQGRPRRELDTGRWAPKSVALEDRTSSGVKPRIPAKDSVVYEAHVRGITQHPSSARLSSLLQGVDGFAQVRDIPSTCRGTYRAAGELAPYLKALGISVIELLPVHEIDNDSLSVHPAEGNFWGYMTYGYFAPDRRYACDRAPGGPTREFKAMVKAFHDAGLEVWLDVVYNHTGEGGLWDASKQTAELTSFRGLDNASYYALVGGDPGSYWESTGTGNNFNATTAVSQALILDSLTYWLDTMGVDGFRFDLATVLGRDVAYGYHFNPGARLLQDIAALGASRDADMVAEAWDINAYGVGQFPAGWGEWNGRFRDASRKFLKGDTSGAGISYADAFFGDFGNFADQGGPSRSVNFIVAHDGFTLADLVSYNHKTNTSRQWPFGPSGGGSDSNESWDSGGDQALRRQRFRNFMVWQLFSRGIPMLVYGDELARSQNGNNNPYNLDSVATWTNYELIAADAPHRVATGAGGEAPHDNFGEDARRDGKNAAFLFTRDVLRMRTGWSALRQDSYAMPISFARHDGSPGFNSSSDRAVRIHLDGSAAGDADVLLFVNMFTSVISFTAPPADSGHRWIRVVDTAAWAEAEGNTWTVSAGLPLQGSYGVQPWSIAVFRSVPVAAPPVPVTFTCEGCTTFSGQDVYVVGSVPGLGSWSPAAAVKLFPSAYPRWTGTVSLPAGQAVEYKFIKKAGAAVTWESGANRTFTVPSAGTGATGGTWR